MRNNMRLNRHIAVLPKSGNTEKIVMVNLHNIFYKFDFTN